MGLSTPLVLACLLLLSQAVAPASTQPDTSQLPQSQQSEVFGVSSDSNADSERSIGGFLTVEGRTSMDSEFTTSARGTDSLTVTGEKSYTIDSYADGLNGPVFALVVFNDLLIVAGSFSVAGDIPVSNIAAWDGGSWQALGSGLNSEVFALSVFDNKLVAGGRFTTAGGVAANRIAEWDGSSWSPLLSGMNETVSALTVYDNYLVAGGSFNTAGGLSASHIAAWDGNSWRSLGGGLNYPLSTLIAYNGYLIAGGVFPEVFDQRHVWVWNGTTWSTMGGVIYHLDPSQYDAVNAFAIHDGRLVIGGNFTIADGINRLNIAAWNGNSWSPLGSGLRDDVFALTVFDGELVAGGKFLDQATSIRHVAAWNGSTWSPLGIGMNSDVYAFCVYDGKLVAGGSFTTAGGISANRIAAWDGNDWSPIEQMYLPDLAVEEVTIPATMVANSTVEVTWVVTNTGDTTASSSWIDAVYLTRSLSTPDSLVGELAIVDDLLQGETYSRSFALNFVDGQEGDWLIKIHTDLEDSVSELDELNNVQVTYSPINILPFPYPDLAITRLSHQSLALAGSSLQVDWEVKNIGVLPADAAWTDRVYLSADQVVGNDFLLFSIDRSGSLEINDSYSMSQRIPIPEDLAGQFYVLVQTDASNTVAEGLSTANNLRFSDSTIQILPYPYPDLVVDSIEVPPTALAGREINLRWFVRNQGLGGTNAGPWTDRVYLSTDQLIGNDIFLFGIDRSGSLDVNESYSVSQRVPVSKEIAGQYFVLVQTDALNTVAEGLSTANNFRFSDVPVQVLPFPYPDLVIDSIEVPPTALAGREFNLRWFVRNQGIGGTNAGSWNDRIYLSPIPTFDPFVALFMKDVQNFSALDSGEAHVNSTSFILPKDRVGSYYIFVQSDINLRVGESNEANNRAISRVIDIQIPPLPDMQMDSLYGPASAIPGQDITINWVDHNRGSAKAERTWVDAFYLSFDQSLDGSDKLIFSRSKGLNLIPGGLDDDFPTSLDVGARYSGHFSFKLPQGLYGHYYLLGVIDQSDVIFEFAGESNNTTVGNLIDVTLVGPPDLVVSSVASDPSAYSGKKMSISWTVQNSGLGSTVDDQTIWDDRVYLSPTPELNISDLNTKSLGTFAGGSGQFDPGEEYTLTKEVTIPNGLQGSYHIFVTTDIYNEVWENGADSNNTTRRIEPIEVFLSPWPDLQVTSISTVDAATAGETIGISYTVSNMGNAEVDTIVRLDRIYISQSESFTNTAQLLASLSVDSLMQPMQNYTRSAQVTIPAGYEGNTYIFVETDALNTVFENTDENNNRLGSQPILVGTYPYCDLVVSSASVPASALSGEMISVQWQVSNQSGSAMLGSQWSDGVILSQDQVPGNADDLLLNTFVHSGVLGQGNSYPRIHSVRLPYGESGRRYIFVRADYHGNTRESNEGNNYSSPMAIDLTLAPSPDLEISDLSVKGRLYAGQRLDIGWRVANIGLGNAQQQNWFDAIYLSPDATISPSDLRLGVREHSGGLLVGENYLDSTFVDVPNYLTGQYYLLVRTDNQDKVYEGDSEANNAVSRSIRLSFAPLSDLIVTDIQIPDSATPGEDITVSWTLRNIGVNPAQGFIREAVYVSEDTLWQLEDPGLGVRDAEIDLAPGASRRFKATLSLANTYRLNDQGEITDKMPGVLEGTYTVIVKTDVRSAFRELSESNNIEVSSTKIHTSIHEARLGSPIAFALTSGETRCYGVHVPRGLHVSLNLHSTCEDAANLMLISVNDIPSVSNFKLIGEPQLSNNQSAHLVTPDSGTVYVTVIGSDLGLECMPQELTLTITESLFEITAVFPTAVFSPSVVTVEVTGTNLDGVSSARLVSKTDTSTFASKVEIVGSTKCLATFKLSDRLDAGDYSLLLVKESLILNPEFLATDYSGDSSKVPFLKQIEQASIPIEVVSKIPHPRSSSPVGLYLSYPSKCRSEGFPITIYWENVVNENVRIPLINVVFDTTVNIRSGTSIKSNVTGLSFAGFPDGKRNSWLRPGERGSKTLLIDPPEVRHRILDFNVYISDSNSSGGPDLAELAESWGISDGGVGNESALESLTAALGTTWGEYTGAIYRLLDALGDDGSEYSDDLYPAIYRIYREHLDAEDFAEETDTLKMESPAYFYREPSGADSAQQSTEKAPCVLPDLELLGLEASTNFAVFALFETDPLSWWRAARGDASPWLDAYTLYHQSWMPIGPNFYGNEPYIVNSHSNAGVAAKAKYFAGTRSKTPQKVNQFVLDSIITPAVKRYVEDRDIYDDLLLFSDPWVQQTFESSPGMQPLLFEEFESGELFAIFHGVGKGAYIVRSIQINSDVDRLRCEAPRARKVHVKAKITYKWTDDYNFKPYLGWIAMPFFLLQDCQYLTTTYSSLELDFDNDFELEVKPGGCLESEYQCGNQCNTPRNCHGDESCGGEHGSPEVLVANDPNDIIGPNGHGDDKWLNLTQPLLYMIRFENDSLKATAPAQVVEVTQKLDSDLDWRSFRLGSFNFAGLTFDVPENTALYSKRLDVRNKLGVYVDVTAGIKLGTGEAFWNFRSIDPLTGTTPTDPLAGLLPVNNAAGDGNGFVSYTIKPKATVQSGDVINAQASIIFDINEPIATPEIFNTIDASAPTSQINALPAMSTSKQLSLQWLAEDPIPGSGIRDFALYMSVNDSAYQLVASGIETQSFMFEGETGKKYAFYTVAYDNVGNSEPAPISADATVTISSGVCGDFNSSGEINLTDVVMVVNYVFLGGPQPTDPSRGDIDCNGRTNIGDAVRLVYYLYSGGPMPCAGC